MKMSVIGCGHLGATLAACMASIGHDVIGVDIDAGKVTLLNAGKSWFYEPDLDPMLAEAIAAGRLRFTTDFAAAAEFATVHFVGVPTPGRSDGAYDLSQLDAAARALAPHLRGENLIIGKSTVPPGTGAWLQTMVCDLVELGQASAEVVWNPDFQREGHAVQDTLKPDRIVVGTFRSSADETVREVYRPLTDEGIPLIITDHSTAELAKGAANAFLAMKISFINAMADICAATGGDIEVLAASLGIDPRIGMDFLRAGIGYGGPSLPTDVRGLGAFARELGTQNAVTLLTAVNEINVARADQAVALVEKAANGVAGKRVAAWGATFRADTDDVRDSAALLVAERLRSLGARVTVYDPMGSGNAQASYPKLGYVDSAAAAATDADVVVVLTAWPEFARANPTEIASVARGAVVVDACQGINAAAWHDAGWRVSSLTGGADRD